MRHVFFEKGIKITGSTLIININKVMKAVSEGAFECHLFSPGAQKMCIVNGKIIY